MSRFGLAADLSDTANLKSRFTLLFGKTGLRPNEADQKLICLIGLPYPGPLSILGQGPDAG